MEMKTSFRLYTPKEVAAFLKLSPQTIRDLIQSGKLQAVKIGRKWRVPETSLEALTKIPTRRGRPTKQRAHNAAVSSALEALLMDE